MTIISCPPIADLTLVQATYFDNGKPIHPVRKSKTARGKGKNPPQHMVTLAVWTDADIELERPDFRTNIIMIEHHKLPRRLATWLSKGSISQEFHDDITALHAGQGVDAFGAARTYYGPLFDRGKGQTYLDGQLLHMVIEGGAVHSATLVIEGAAVALPAWATTYCSGTPLKGTAKGMCRLDRCDFSSSWRTCS